MRTTGLERPGACPHGYAVDIADIECPRCADRPHHAPVAAADRLPSTRWHATDTTLGPGVKTLLTLALVIPPLIMLFALGSARAHPANTVLVVPIAAFVVINVQLMPALWERGRRR
jgi:hypothetical protein